MPGEAKDRIVLLIGSLVTGRSRVAAADIKDGEGFEAWLENKPRELCVLMAARAALRALPLFQQFRGKGPRHFLDLTASLFRAPAIARVVALYPTRANEHASAARAAYVAADAAAHAAEAAADARVATTRTSWTAIRDDARVFERQGMPDLIAAPLWSAERPSWTDEAWSLLQNNLPKGENWDVWTNWYEDRINGSNRGEANEVVYATVPLRVWEQGSQVANAYIRERLVGLDEPRPSATPPSAHNAEEPDENRVLQSLPSRKPAAQKTAATLSVLYSYAWQPHDPQQKVQLDFFKRLTHLVNQRPPEFEYLPKIELWRDAERLENAHSVEAQIASACNRAFLLLALMSRKYPGSDGCMMEFDRFVDAQGENLSGKQAIVVAVNCRPEDVSPRFSSPLRLWMLDDGKTLLEAMRRSEASKDHFARRVAGQI